MGKFDDAVSEFLSESEKSTVTAVVLSQQESLVKNIFQVFEENHQYSKYLEPVCEQLFKFCRSDIEDLQRFSSYYIPVALSLYLRLSRQPDAAGRDLKFLEIYLLTAYNIETCDPEGKEVVHSFTVPALHKPSIYHESTGIPASAALTENALSRLEHGLHDVKVVIGPFKEALKITKDNIHQIASLLMRVYNANISYMPNISKEATLKGAQRIISQKRPRIELGTEYLLEVLHCAYFSMFNGQYVLGNETIAMIRQRGCQSLIPEVCLVANAMKQSLLDSKDKTGDAMGIRIVNSSFKNLTKNVLTNASFKTRKLSEDDEDDDTSTVASTGSSSKRDTYKAQLHETLGSIDESIELTQVTLDTDGTVGVHKSTSSSSGKMRKGSLVLIDGDNQTTLNGSSNSTMV